jgi:ferredoxin
VDQYPWYYIDPDTCIDCGACVPECPFEAIFPLDEVPSAYIAKGGEKVTMPKGTAGFNEVYDGADHFGNPVHIESARTLQAGERLDLRDATQMNADYYTKGPGYGSK